MMTTLQLRAEFSQQPQLGADQKQRRRRRRRRDQRTNAKDDVGSQDAASDRRKSTSHNSMYLRSCQVR